MDWWLRLFVVCCLLLFGVLFTLLVFDIVWIDVWVRGRLLFWVCLWVLFAVFLVYGLLIVLYLVCARCLWLLCCY